MAVDVLLLLVGLGGLTVGGSLLVTGAAGIGLRFGLAPAVVGLTIVAAGTSAPELAVTGQAVASGDSALAVGGVIGSNIANILLVLGVAALMGTITVASRVVRLDVPLMVAASVAFALAALDGELGRVDGAILVAGLIAFVWWTMRRGDDGAAEEVPEAPGPLWRTVAELVGGLVVLVVAARVVVANAESLAVDLGVPELVVGLTVVALGTSAPEIATTVIAARRGEQDLAVGNAVGSNIFNVLMVLGLPALLAGIEVDEAARSLDLPIMVAVAVACLPIIAYNHRLDRWEGLVFVGYYAAYLTYLALDATDHATTDGFGLVMVVFVVPLTVLTIATVAWRERRHLADRRAHP